MIRAIHQFVPSFAFGDAIGAHSREVRDLVRGMGYDSEIYCLESRGAAPGEARDYRSFAGRKRSGVVLIYQLSTGSPVADFVRQRPEPKAVNYHNITPPALFAPWEPHVAVELTRGRQQLAELAPVCLLGIGDSAYNTAEMTDAGYARGVVAPVLLRMFPGGPEEAPADPVLAGELRQAKLGGGRDWLFVGRLAPNKRQHDVVASFAAYRRLYDPHGRLHLVGGSSSDAYRRALTRFVASLGLSGCVSIAGSVSPGALSAYYGAADVFVCLSRHEGFCVPLLEAWAHDIPVVALASAAVPETLGGAGLLLQHAAPPVVAAAANRVLADEGLAGRIVAAGRARLAELTGERARGRYREAVKELVGAAE
ncbi:MAG: glycosyltransferase [Acidimicrobiales bacterium]